MTQRTEITVTVELPAETIARMFEDEFDGWCPVCKNETINLGESICCGCFEQALAYHINTCGCYP